MKRMICILLAAAAVAFTANEASAQMGKKDYINGGTLSGSVTLKPGEFRLLTDF